MLDLVTKGPLAIGFEVYDDFMNYRSGVYTHVPSVSSKVWSSLCTSFIVNLLRLSLSITFVSLFPYHFVSSLSVSFSITLFLPPVTHSLSLISPSCHSLTLSLIRWILLWPLTMLFLLSDTVHTHVHSRTNSYLTIHTFWRNRRDWHWLLDREEQLGSPLWWSGWLLFDQARWKWRWRVRLWVDGCGCWSRCAHLNPIKSKAKLIKNESLIFNGPLSGHSRLQVCYGSIVLLFVVY